MEVNESIVIHPGSRTASKWTKYLPGSSTCLSVVIQLSINKQKNHTISSYPDEFD
ncbi:MAG TPA: hypothetical protein VLS94_00710 [Fusibacter sp.]|nr:hypothetical protein [Fusibacter sp.]